MGDSRPNASSRASSQESADRVRIEADDSIELRSLHGAPPEEIRKVSLESSAVAAAHAIKQLYPAPASSAAAQFRLHIPVEAVTEGVNLPKHWEQDLRQRGRNLERIA
eukprot:7011863-Pyramimonas_sp.AAC.1